MAARPDVRVRLSAEGVAEVVSALKRVQAEGQKTATKGKRGFQGFNNVLGNTTNLIGGLVIALAVRQFASFIRNSMTAADQINKLGRKVGATTEHLSALALVARTADADLNMMGVSLAKMNRYIGQAQAGNIQAIATFRDLGLELEDFKGKDAVEIFELMAKKIVALPTAIRQGDAAMKVFGRSGAKLLPTMQDLAEEGLGGVIERAKELGVLIDYDMAAVSERIKDDMEILKMQSEAIGARFISGFGPELSQALQTITGDVSQTTEAWEGFGSGVGRVMKSVVGVVSAAFDIVGHIWGGMATTIVSMTKTIALAARGDLAGAKREMTTYKRWIDGEFKDISERMKGRFELSLQAPDKPSGEPSTVVTGDEDVEKELAELAAKKATALQAALNTELSLAKIAASLRTAAEKREFDQGLQNVETYYADRRAIADAAYDQELAVLAQKTALLADMADPAIRLQEEKKIETETAKARMAHERAVTALISEERETIQSLALERVALEQQLLNLQGDRIAADRLGFEERIAQADLLLRKAGESDATREAKLAELRTALEAGASFEETKRDAEAALSELDLARQEIEARTQAGLMAQFASEEQILALEMERVETLRELALSLEAAARATGDPEKIAQAVAFASSIDEIAYSVEASTDAFATFKATALDATTDALTDFLETGLSGSKNLKESMRDMATSVIASLKKLAAQLLATALMKRMAGFFGMGGEVGGGGDFIGPPVAGGATGGWFRGIGGIDKNLVWLTDKEFVVREAITRQPGVLAHLRKLNEHGLRGLISEPTVMALPTVGMASGGLVGDSTSTGEDVGGRLTVGLEDGLVLRELDTPHGARVIVELMNKHRRAVKAALGT
jgi:hypothetical protein